MPKNFAGIPEEKKCLRRGRLILAGSNMKLKEIGCENVDYICLAQDILHSYSVSLINNLYAF